jgi:hypothetical protein
MARKKRAMTTKRMPPLPPDGLNTFKAVAVSDIVRQIVRKHQRPSPLSPCRRKNRQEIAAFSQPPQILKLAD